MLVNNTNITDKKYKKLTLQISLKGFSFSCTDTLNRTLLSFKEIIFDSSNKSVSIEDQLANIFKLYVELNESYDEIVILHENNLATFVPTALFDEHFLSTYLQFNTKVFDTDFFAFDKIETYQMNTVYIPYVNFNNFFVDQFGQFTYKHAHTILVSKLLELSKNVEDKKMFVHINMGHFEIIVVQNQKLLLFNSFEYQTPEDLLYYILFTAEQLNLNPENLKLEFLGAINQEDAYFKIAYQYIRNVNLLDVSDLQKNNSFSTADHLKHFILFQS
jgi:hypothetical protein